MSMIVQELSLELIVQLRPLIPAIERHDASLARPLQPCASSIALNIAEGEYSDTGTKRARFHSAAGSAGETRAALRVAACWRHLAGAQVGPSLAMLDRLLGMPWKLTH